MVFYITSSFCFDKFYQRLGLYRLIELAEDMLHVGNAGVCMCLCASVHQNLIHALIPTFPMESDQIKTVCYYYKDLGKDRNLVLMDGFYGNYSPSSAKLHGGRHRATSSNIVF